MSKKSKVQINYKSGNSITVECDRFSIKRSSISTSMEWEGISPTPLMIGVDDIESVWEL